MEFAAPHCEVNGGPTPNGRRPPGQLPSFLRFTRRAWHGEVNGVRLTQRAARIETEDIVEAGRWRYAHFRAPDGNRYELLEGRVTRGSDPAANGQ